MNLNFTHKWGKNSKHLQILCYTFAFIWKRKVVMTLPGIKVHPNERFEEAYRKFKKQVDRNLVVTEVRARRFFEPMTEIRKKQKISARKKMLKRLYMLRRYESRLWNLGRGLGCACFTQIFFQHAFKFANFS